MEYPARVAARALVFAAICAPYAAITIIPSDDSTAPIEPSLRGRLLSEALAVDNWPSSRRLLPIGSGIRLATGGGRRQWANGVALPLASGGGGSSGPCTMHTYFASINGDAEEAAANDNLMAKWRGAWEAVGWETRVLTEEDAKGHPEYASLREAFYKLPTVNDPNYEAACFLRHLAMAHVGGGWMVDYDVVPLALPACASPTAGGAFMTYEDFVPALVSASSAEFLRVAHLFAALPWRDHPETFSYLGKPHVSDMLALKHLQTTGAISVYGPFRCGVVEASDVFDSAGGVRCRDGCTRPPQPAGSSASSASSASAAGSGGKEQQPLWGPLGAHFSHASVDIMSGSEVAARYGKSALAPAVAKGDGRWLPADVVRGLKDMYTANMTRATVHTVRARLVELSPQGYRAVCPAAVSGQQQQQAGGSAAAAAEAEVQNLHTDCHAPCGGVAGLCPSFCGREGSCCRKGLHADAKANGDSTCGPAIRGCSGIHCCVKATRGFVLRDRRGGHG